MVTAVLLYESTGYISLVEKYGCSKHPKKMEPYCDRVPENVRNFLDELDGGHPDLFSYDPGGADWFFCEVKSHTDSVRATQRICWRKLEELTRREIRLIQFHQL